MVARDLQALQYRTALQALKVLRSEIAKDLQALQSLTA